MAVEDDRSFFDRLKKVDPKIETVFDVGAYHGWWSTVMAESFPNAHYHLFEPRYSFDSELLERTTRWCNHYGFANTINPLAVTEHGGPVDLGVHGDDGVASSVLLNADSADAGTQAVESISLDEYVSLHDINRVDFLKMDIQGGELAALRGARETLASTKFLLLETWFVRSYGGRTPVFAEMLEHLAPLGFVPYDFLGIHYSPTSVPVHVDAVFVNTELSPLEAHFHAEKKQ